jgi:SEL1 protein
MALSGFWFAEQAKEYFRRAADTGDSHGNYNLGVLYLQGMGVKKDVKEACKNFLIAADKGHPKAFYQLAKMQQKGIPGMKKDVATVSTNAFVYENVHAPSALFP